MKAANRNAHLAGVHDRALLAGVHDRSRPCVHDCAQVFTTVRFFGKQEDASTDTLASVPDLACTCSRQYRILPIYARVGTLAPFHTG